MLASRSRLYFGLVAGAALLVYWLVRPMHAEVQGTQSDRISELKEQRLATLRRLVTVTTEHYKNGEASLEDLCSAKRAKDEAELELCASKNTKIAILERIVQEAKQLEEQSTRLVANKLASESCLLKAKADRLQQEINLEQARSE